MRAIDLEARVISAVDQIRAGQSVENDFIECKRDWPKENKARQLAGSLNRAAGDPVVYIIGIDEKDGAVHDVAGTDILDWWAQITNKFDHTPPEMTRHIHVPVGPNGESVVAVAIASDRAPYVVKTGSANPSLEVPMREGTGTRSARRDELLRMLIPSIRLPEVIALQGFLRATYRPEVRKATPQGRSEKQEEALVCSGNLRIFIAHNGRETVTLPTHIMRGRLWIGDEAFATKVGPQVLDKDKQPDPLAAPITTREAITVTTSGAVTLGFTSKDIPPHKRRILRNSPVLKLDIDLEVLGAARPVRLTVDMHREDGHLVKTEYEEALGKWVVDQPETS